MSNKLMTQNVLRVTALAFLLSAYMILLLILNLAYIHGGEILITTNTYNEAFIEILVLHLIGWPVVTVGVYNWLLETPKQPNKTT